MQRLRLTLSCNDYDRTRFLIDGTVVPAEIDLTAVALSSRERHERFTRDLEFDVCKLQMGVFLGWKARGAPFSAIPVFPHRKFCHGNVLIRRKERNGTTSRSCRENCWYAGTFQSRFDLDARPARGRIRCADALLKNSYQRARAGSGLGASNLDEYSAAPERPKGRRAVGAR